MNEAGDLIPFASNLWSFSEKDVRDSPTFLAVEYGRTDLLPLPLRAHQIECNEKFCQKVREFCLLESAFSLDSKVISRLLAAGDLKEEHPFIESVQNQLQSNCKLPILVNSRDLESYFQTLLFLALSGNQVAQECYQKLSKSRDLSAEDSENLQKNLEQVEFAARACPRSKAPPPLTIEKKKGVGLTQLTGETLLIATISSSGVGLGTSLARDVELQGALPIFVKLKDSWHKISPSEYFESLAGKGLLQIPSKLKSNVHSVSVDLPIKLNFPFQVYFDGKILGEVQATEMDAKRIKLVFKNPSTKEKLVELIKKEYRPLLISKGKPSDPERWKRAKAPAESVAAAKTKFMADFPFHKKCVKPAKQGPTHRETSQRVTEKELVIHERSFTSRQGAHLFGLSIKGVDCEDDSGSEPTSQVHWYYQKSNDLREVAVLNPNLGPIEAGDFDGDGQSEWIFSDWKHDFGSYTIHWNEFKDSSEKKN